MSFKALLLNILNLSSGIVVNLLLFIILKWRCQIGLSLMNTISFFQPLPYSTLAIEFHHSKDAESNGDSGLECSKTRVECFRELIGDDVVACPKDACAWYQREDAADEEHRNGALPPCRL